MTKRNAVRLLALAGAAAFVPLAAAAEDYPAGLRDLTNGDPFFYTSDQDVKEDDGQKALVGVGRPTRTHSQVPHLPFYLGYLNTNYTYRFVTVAEQVFSMIGEGKHGLWRVQESGTIREYRRKDAKGLPRGADPEDPANVEAVKTDYAPYLPGESWSGYKYPDEQFGEDGRLNYVDLPITHPKYGGKYAEHPPVDLANFFCTMSEADFPYSAEALRFAFAQPGANQVGPLGKRAGLDIRENYTNVLRLNHFPDARSWVNVGVEGEDGLHVDWQPVDTRRTAAEYYLVERPFFNTPYLFVTAVFDNVDNEDFRYVRPDGPYFRSLGDGADALKTDVTPAPRFATETVGVKEAVGLPVYGVHHPDRSAFGGGGACPLKGGDWGRYPDPAGGSGWPTQYEEVTPLCDAVLVDIKFYSNLDGRDWNDPGKYLANAATGSKTVTYKLQPGRYGDFRDPYNTARGATNPQAADLPSELAITFPAAGKPVGYTPVAATRYTSAMQPAASTSCRPVAN